MKMDVTEEIWKRVPRLNRLWFKEVNDSPVIVLGNQKSGTSAIAHLLADYAGLLKTIDIPESWWPTLQLLLMGNLDLKEFICKNPHIFCTDIIKEPNLTFFYSDLKDTYSEAHFVFVVRDPRSNVRSILDRLDLPGDRREVAHSLENLPHEWRHLFNREIWGLQGSNYIDLLAERWRKAAHVYLSDSSSMNLALRVFCPTRLELSHFLLRISAVTENTISWKRPISSISSFKSSQGF